MKIIIDIPDAIYERFGYEYSEQNIISKDVNEAILYAFCDGTPLPKGHGDLIDRNEFHHTLEDMPIKNNDKWFNWLQKACNRLAEAPTIIEADKGDQK